MALIQEIHIKQLAYFSASIGNNNKVVPYILQDSESPCSEPKQLGCGDFSFPQSQIKIALLNQVLGQTTAVMAWGQLMARIGPEMAS